MKERIVRLARDAAGATTLEFALIAPVMFMLIMGLGELTYQSYIQSVLTGAVQKAARDSTIQGNQTEKQTQAIDDEVKKIVRSVISSATFTSTRNSYSSYSAISGEPFTDSKFPADTSGTYDGICNHGEPYVDVNNNGRYDIDLSSSGDGGAKDVVKYTMTVSYHRLFPVSFFTWGDVANLSSTTLLKNQPYASQATQDGTSTGNCQ